MHVFEMFVPERRLRSHWASLTRFAGVPILSNGSHRNSVERQRAAEAQELCLKRFRKWLFARDAHCVSFADAVE